MTGSHVLSLLTINIRGLRKKKKRLSVFKWLKKQDCDIIFIQQAYCVEKDVNRWKREWGGELFALCSSVNSKGFLTLISPKCQVDIHDVIKKSNRYMCNKIKINNEKYNL